MNNRELAEKLRCTATVHDIRPNCDACPFYIKEELPEGMQGEYPGDWLYQCDVDKVALMAADALANSETHILVLL